MFSWLMLKLKIVKGLTSAQSILLPKFFSASQSGQAVFQRHTPRTALEENTHSLIPLSQRLANFFCKGLNSKPLGPIYSLSRIFFLSIVTTVLNNPLKMSKSKKKKSQSHSLRKKATGQTGPTNNSVRL